jgi:hypothetical protein
MMIETSLTARGIRAIVEHDARAALFKLAPTLTPKAQADIARAIGKLAASHLKGTVVQRPGTFEPVTMQ